MVDPETARQAAEAWDQCRATADVPWRFERAGDVLAKLVPQLLDQLAAERSAVKDILTSAPAPQIIADLRGQLAEQYAEVEALGERCRQLETALQMVVTQDDGHTSVEIARAALGEGKS